MYRVGDKVEIRLGTGKMFVQIVYDFGELGAMKHHIYKVLSYNEAFPGEFDVREHSIIRKLVDMDQIVAIDPDA